MEETLQSFLEFVMVASGGLFFVAIILMFIVIGWMIFRIFSSKVISSEKILSPFYLSKLSQSIGNEKSASSLKKISRYTMIIWTVGFIAAILLIVQAIFFSR